MAGCPGVDNNPFVSLLDCTVMRTAIKSKRTLLLCCQLTCLFLSTIAFAQSSKNGGQVKLIGWKSLDCDNTYDPYRLIARVTVFDVQHGRTYLILNFSDHCCPTFNPKIEFKDNNLLIVPYEQGNVVTECDCYCCFSIELQIDGLPGKGYEVYFRGKRIEQSDDPYLVLEPSQELYNGRVINRKNKYGFHEGTWI